MPGSDILSNQLPPERSLQRLFDKHVFQNLIRHVAEGRLPAADLILSRLRVIFDHDRGSILAYGEVPTDNIEIGQLAVNLLDLFNNPLIIGDSDRFQLDTAGSLVWPYYSQRQPVL